MVSNNLSCFLDANILLEILLDRQNNHIARGYLQHHAGNLGISALTAHLVIHFGTVIVGLPVLRKFLDDYKLQSLTDADFAWAFQNARNDDFEDALQLAVAIRAGYDEFVTFDKTLYEAYKTLPTIAVKLLA